jgi:hypothetical protein
MNVPDWMDVLIRGILFIAALFFMTKLLGSKQISQLSFFEYISGMTIGSVAGEVITRFRLLALKFSLEGVHFQTKLHGRIFPLLDISITISLNTIKNTSI